MNDSKLAHYWKIVLYTIGAVAAVGTDVVQTIVTNKADGQFTKADFIQVIILAVTGYAVYAKKNKPLPVDVKPQPLGAGEVTEAGW